jgi:hypothetical protein
LIVSHHFTCFPTEGAALILPDGAIRENLHYRREISEFALSHGADWFKHVHDTLGLLEVDVPLYLVTGVDKCSNWCLASYPEIAGDTGMALRFTPIERTTSAATRPYSYSTSGPITPRACHLFADGAKNQTVFIRGFRMLKSRNPSGSVQITDVLTSKTVNSADGANDSVSQAGGGVSSRPFGGTLGESQPQHGTPGPTPGPGSNGVIIESFPTLSKVACFVFEPVFRFLDLDPSLSIHLMTSIYIC